MYLLDSDAAKSLCQYLLLDELALALECPLSDFAILPQLRFQLRLNKPDAALKKLGSQDAVVTAQRLVEAATEVQVVTDSANTILELNRPDIDSGEAILFAAVSQDEDDALITGDKRALIALSEISEVPIGDSMRTWTPSPRTLGQRFHADLDTHSTAPWTLIPRALGQ